MGSAVAGMSVEQPDVRYCMTEDGVRLAYYAIGEGPALVRASGFPSHLAGMWAMPGAEDGSRLTAQEHHVVSYDARGMGLSQRVLDFSLDTRVADLRAIVRHLGLERFALLGWGHSTPLAMAYAARYPAEVSHLVLSAPYADGPQLYETSTAFSAYAALESVTVAQWDFVVNTIAHGITGFSDAAAAKEMAALIQASISAEGYVAYRRDNRLTSVTGELSAITCPTLVVAARTMKSFRPNCRRRWRRALRTRGSSWMSPVDVGSISIHSRRMWCWTFCGRRGRYGRRGPRPHRRCHRAEERARGCSETAVILFTDIVDSTALTERLGDARFREVSRALDAGLRAAIREAGGVAVEGKLLGDGVLATFASAAQAIDGARRCLALSAASELGLHIGLHAGDVIREGGQCVRRGGEHRVADLRAVGAGGDPGVGRGAGDGAVVGGGGV